MERVLREAWESRDLWAGAGAAAICAAVLVVLRKRRTELATVAAIVVASWARDVGSFVAFALMAATAAAWRGTRSAWTLVVSTVSAAGAVYACVPDTERALIVLGVVTVLGVASLLWRWPWDGAGAVVGVALCWVAVTDGSPRTSAVVGALAIVVVHLLLELWFVSDPRVDAALPVGLVAMWVASRVAGTGSGLARPLVISALCILATGLSMLPRWRARRAPHPS